MAEMKQKGVGALVANPKLRILIAGVVIVGVVVGAVVGWRIHLKHQQEVDMTGARVVSAPDITSTPGARQTSQQYTQDVQARNIAQSQAARTAQGIVAGQSNVPTINQPGLVGNVSDFDNPGTMSDGRPICPEKVVTTFAPNPTACTVDSLTSARQAGVKASELRCQGCTCNRLKAAGFTASDLRIAGFSVKALNTCGFNWAALKAAGFSAAALKAAGASAAELKAAGYTAAQLKNAGYSAKDLLSAGYTPKQLATAGYSSKDLLNAGVTPSQLKAAGYTAAQLKDAGVSADDLAKAGFSAADLAKAGFTAADLKKAGFTPDQIKAALAAANAKVCSKTALEKARNNGASTQALLNKGCSIAALRAAGVTAAELKAAGVSAAALNAAGYTAADLKKAGYTAAQLKNAGFSAAQLKNAGFSAKALKDAGFSPKALHDAGYSAKALKDAGYSARALKDAGYSAGQLKNAGFSAKALKDAGFSAKALKNAGFTAGQLLNAGVSPKELAAAGFTKGDLVRAGLSPAEAGLSGMATGSSTGKCSVQSLRKARLAGSLAKDQANNGCSLAALKAAGYSAGDLLKAGFTPTQLHDAGFSAGQLAAAGVSAAALKKAGFSARELAKAGFTPAQLVAAGFTPSQIAQAERAIGQSGAAGMRGPNGSGANGINGNGGADGMNGDGGANGLGGDDTLDNLSKAYGNTPEDRLKALQLQQQETIARAQLANKKQQIYGLMDSEAQKLLSGWAKQSSQKYVASNVKDKELTGATKVITYTKNGKVMHKVVPVGAGDDLHNGAVIKAGTVMFGILTTGINTDEQSPILAKIISGTLKGSTLMGSFTRENTKVMLKFTKLNMPDQKNTISINMVAIDPNTARTVVAGHVNNHYLLRYGSIFASGFLGALGQALTNANTICLGNSPLTCFKQTTGFSPTEQLLIGLGGMGTQFSNQIASKEDKAPTVQVPAGTSIGLLLMSDFNVPKSNLPTPVLAPSKFNHQANAQ